MLASFPTTPASSAVTRGSKPVVYAADDPDVDESVVIRLRLVRLCDVRLTDAPLGWYRIRRNSLSRDSATVEAFGQALIAAFSRTA